MHIVTLSFDDGFLKSCLRIAKIYEKHKLSACFNVIATGHLSTFVPPDQWMAAAQRGDFKVWNELQARGHEILPHGYRHADKAGLPFAESQKLIIECLAIFERELKGFKSKETIFNFPYNATTPELNAWLVTVVKAYRITGGLNPLPYRGQVALTSMADGPGNCEAHLDRHIEMLLGQPSGWLLYILHGLDDEGFGPIRAEYLDRLLGRLKKIESVVILPTGKALGLASRHDVLKK